jgi:hypothetical protein
MADDLSTVDGHQIEPRDSCVKGPRIDRDSHLFTPVATTV